MAAASRRRGGSDRRFVVFTAEEGLEGEPKVKILPVAEAATRFAESGGRPVDDTLYGGKGDLVRRFHESAVNKVGQAVRRASLTPRS
jgi:hypothetical protein